jgi:hypothetical protein
MADSINSVTNFLLELKGKNKLLIVMARNIQNIYPKA